MPGSHCVRSQTKYTFIISICGQIFKFHAKKLTRSYHIATSDRFRKIGGWNWNRSKGVDSFLLSPLSAKLNEVYADFGGRHLKGAVKSSWPFFQVTPLETYDGPYQEAVPHSGIDLNVINSIASKLNFT